MRLRSIGDTRYGDAALSEKVFDIARAQREPMVQPDGMTDDIGWKAMASTQRLHRSNVAEHREFDNAGIRHQEILDTVQ